MKDKEKVRQYNADYYRKNKDTLLPKLRVKSNKWCKENKERRNQNERTRRLKMGDNHPNISATRKHRKKLRDAALDVYGRKCSCCHETIDEFLTIDHINGGGRKHRSQITPGGGSFNQWLKKNGYPKGFRTMCWNCNWSAFVGKGVCIHKRNELRD